jgi:positive regulator of sigma E activity
MRVAVAVNRRDALKRTLIIYLLVLIVLALVLGIGIPLHLGALGVGLMAAFLMAAVLIPATIVRFHRRQGKESPSQSDN